MAINSPIQGGIRAVRNTVSNSLFTGRAVPPPQSDPITTNLLTQNTASLGNVSSQLSGVAQSIDSLRFSLSLVKSNLDLRTQLDRQRSEADFDRERRLATLRLREGKESVIENKIQAALMTPVQKVGGAVRGVLSKLMGAFNTLFYGWLGSGALELYDAVANKNKEAQNKIIGRITRTLATGAGIIIAAKFGSKKLLLGASQLALRLFKFRSKNGVALPFIKAYNIFKASLAFFAGWSIWDWLRPKNDDNTNKSNLLNTDGNTNQSSSEVEPPRRSIFNLFGLLGGSPAKAGDLESNVKPTDRMIPTEADKTSGAIPPKNNTFKKGNFFTNMFSGKSKEEQFTEKFEQSIGTTESNVDFSGGGIEFDSTKSRGMSGSSFVSANDTNMTSIKRSTNVSEQLGSLPDEKPIVIPSDGGGNQQQSSPSGGNVVKGSSAPTPSIDAINPDNTYVYHAYQQFNLTPA